MYNSNTSAIMTFPLLISLRTSHYLPISQGHVIVHAYESPTRKIIHLLYLRLRHALWVVINLVYYRQNARVLDYYLSHI